MSLKGFYKSKEIDKGASMATMKINEGDMIMFTSGRSEPYIFKRFVLTGEPNQSWYNSAHGGDGHCLTAK